MLTRLRRAAAVLAVAAIACPVLAACSPGADYPSLFPSVHDIPEPRSETRLDSNQVQQATEDLISARDRLTAEAQSAQGKNSTGSTVKQAAKSPAKSAAKSAVKSTSESTTKLPAGPPGKASGNPATAAAAVRMQTNNQPSNQVGGRQTLGTDERAAGTETK
jgi:hypothetical protein